jgi:hypothetical protein
MSDLGLAMKKLIATALVVLALTPVLATAQKQSVRRQVGEMS